MLCLSFSHSLAGAHHHLAQPHVQYDSWHVRELVLEPQHPLAAQHKIVHPEKEPGAVRAPSSLFLFWPRAPHVCHAKWRQAASLMWVALSFIYLLLDFIRVSLFFFFSLSLSGLLLFFLGFVLANCFLFGPRNGTSSRKISKAQEKLSLLEKLCNRFYSVTGEIFRKD